MDTKEKSLLKHYYEKFITNSFDEKDVYAFLQLLQNRNKEIQCINELAGFVTRRELHNGFIKNYLFEIREKFGNLGKTKESFRIEDVFSFKEMRSGFNKALTELELAGLSNEKMNDLVTCLISLLQQVKIIDKDREIGQLFFALSNKEIILMAEIEVTQNLFKKRNAVFPVLTANNSYVNSKKQDRYDTPLLFVDKVIEIINREGKLEIVIPD
jgi:hypothetical protein